MWTHVIDFLINLVHFFFYHSIQTVSPLYKIGEHSLSDKASPLYDPVSDSNTHPGIHFSDRGASLSHRGAPLSYPVSPVSNAPQSPH